MMNTFPYNNDHCREDDEDSEVDTSWQEKIDIKVTSNSDCVKLVPNMSVEKPTHASIPTPPKQSGDCGPQKNKSRRDSDTDDDAEEIIHDEAPYTPPIDGPALDYFDHELRTPNPKSISPEVVILREALQREKSKSELLSRKVKELEQNRQIEGSQYQRYHRVPSTYGPQVDVYGMIGESLSGQERMAMLEEQLNRTYYYLDQMKQEQIHSQMSDYRPNVPGIHEEYEMGRQNNLNPHTASLVKRYSSLYSKESGIYSETSSQLDSRVSMRKNKCISLGSYNTVMVDKATMKYDYGEEECGFPFKESITLADSKELETRTKAELLQQIELQKRDKNKWENYASRLVRDMVDRDRFFLTSQSPAISRLADFQTELERKWACYAFKQLDRLLDVAPNTLEQNDRQLLEARHKGFEGNAKSIFNRCL